MFRLYQFYNDVIVSIISDPSVVVTMTISYTSDVANASRFGVFTSILIRWKGSVYKLVYKELLAFLAGYFALNIFYRTVLQQKDYERLRNWFEGKAGFFFKLEIKVFKMMRYIFSLQLLNSSLET